MGNQVCCTDDNIRNDLPQTLPTVNRKSNPHVEKLTKTSVPYGNNPNIPKLTKEIQNHLKKQQPLNDQLSKVPIVKQFGDDVYEGELNARGRPHGYGKMYRNNGSLFIGHFQNGVANGIGHLIKPDGSYYKGYMVENKANDAKGYFWSPLLEYKGGISDNKFNGEGVETGQNHQFIGKYLNGNKKTGKLTWKSQDGKYCYEGAFNQNGEFHGKGTLQQSNLGTYEGQFQNGQKHGFGQFNFLGGKKYIGQYQFGEKHGQGRVYNQKGQVTYDGEWSNGLPHGQGKARTLTGQYVERKWVQGLDKAFVYDD